MLAAMLPPAHLPTGAHPLMLLALAPIGIPHPMPPTPALTPLLSQSLTMAPMKDLMKAATKDLPAGLKLPREPAMAWFNGSNINAKTPVSSTTRELASD